MTISTRIVVLRANAISLLVASAAGICADLLGAFLAVGPQRHILGAAPHATIGFVEAHGLAFIIGFLLWRAEPLRVWHLTANGGSCAPRDCQSGLWQIFVGADALWGGYATTSLHWNFAVLQIFAARAAGVQLPKSA